MCTVRTSCVEPDTVLWAGHKQVWLALGAFGADPVHQLAASCRDLVRIKACSAVPPKIKFQHCRVLALSQNQLSVP